ncbi:MAG: response regulator transcription factor [Bacteroidetes bacterium]|nr:response regulator transcription factor [Bacteroidota bacterium]
MIRVAIVEDNNTLRSSLSNLFNKTDGMKCVASLNNLLNVVSETAKSMPDVILMDIGLPHISGIEGVRTVKMNFPEILVMMFTVFEEDDKIFDAIKAGASGYLLKKTPPEEIVEAIKQLYNGGAPMSASIARKVIQSFQQEPSGDLQDYQLTVRENEILYSLIDGLSYKKIADKYCVSISTIRTHICNIYNKLHVNSKAEAVAKVLKR